MEMENFLNKLPVELKTKFEEHLSTMSEEEQEFFWETFRGVQSQDDLKEKTLKMKELEKFNHHEFLVKSNDFLTKITEFKSKQQDERDGLKTDSLLEKIKSI